MRQPLAVVCAVIVSFGLGMLLAGSRGAPGADEAAVLDRLDYEPASVETIARRAGLTPEQVYPILLVLEVGRSVRTDPAGRYMRVC